MAAAGHHPAALLPHTFGPGAPVPGAMAGAAAAPQPPAHCPRVAGPGVGTAICSSLPTASLFTARRTLAQEAAPTCFALSLSQRHLMK